MSEDDAAFVHGNVGKARVGETVEVSMGWPCMWSGPRDYSFAADFAAPAAAVARSGKGPISTARRVNHGGDDDDGW